MKPNQVDVLTRAMSGGPQQVRGIGEAGLARQSVGDIRPLDRLDRVDDDVSVFHRVSAADLDVKPLPDADAAADPSAPDAFTKPFGEDHRCCTLQPAGASAAQTGFQPAH
jgi:hypothetical protein